MVNDGYSRNLTPGEVFARFRDLPEWRTLVEQCYYDNDLLLAARRFYHSEEFRAVIEIARPRNSIPPYQILDLGGGNGVSSISWFWAGHNPVLVEPDCDEIVGIGALKKGSITGGLKIRVCRALGQRLPFAEKYFDIVYLRQVLHHIADLETVCSELRRVLKPGGLIIATREHVISNAGELISFLDNHPVHRFTGGEHAYRIRDYRSAIRKAGFKHIRILGSWATVINYYPTIKEEFALKCYQILQRLFNQTIARSLLQKESVLTFLGRCFSIWDRTPGRMYSFIAEA